MVLMYNAILEYVIVCVHKSETFGHRRPDPVSFGAVAASTRTWSSSLKFRIFVVSFFGDSGHGGGAKRGIAAWGG